MGVALDLAGLSSNSTSGNGSNNGGGTNNNGASGQVTSTAYALAGALDHNYSDPLDPGVYSSDGSIILRRFAFAPGAGSEGEANDASEQGENRGLNDARDDGPLRNVCPDCLNKGMYRAPVVKEGRSFYFYCQ